MHRLLYRRVDCGETLPTKLELENTMDASGMWFAAAVLFAVLAAGIIIYRQ
jgi:hypothetical protein